MSQLTMILNSLKKKNKKNKTMLKKKMKTLPGNITSLFQTLWWLISDIFICVELSVYLKAIVTFGIVFGWIVTGICVELGLQGKELYLFILYSFAPFGISKELYL